MECELTCEVKQKLFVHHPGVSPKYITHNLEIQPVISINSSPERDNVHFIQIAPLYKIDVKCKIV